MFGIDSPELLVILVVALVVIGPKELPGLLKTWGKWMATMRGMASEFRGHVDEMVRQSELDEVKKQLTDSTGGLDFKSLDPTKEMRSIIQDGVAEGEKALAEGKSSLENPLADNPSLDNPPLDNPPPRQSTRRARVGAADRCGSRAGAGTGVACCRPRRVGRAGASRHGAVARGQAQGRSRRLSAN